MRDYFSLYSNCIITKGYNRSALSDLQKNKTILIPNDLVDVIEFLDHKKQNLDETYKTFGLDNKKVIDDYISYLIQNEYGFLCSKDELNHYPKLKNNFEIPNKVYNSIIEIDVFDFDKIKKILFQLHDLNCNYISFFSYSYLTIEDMIKLNELIQELRFISFELTLPYNIFNVFSFISFFKKEENKLMNIVFYGAPFNRVLRNGAISLFEVNILEKSIDSYKHCGIVEMKNFHTNMSSFFESLNHNSCLNKKISIDKNGNIKNCPAMQQSFGHINNTTLEEVSQNPDFTKYWNIKKDEINTCKDCEFRHICTDCRAFTENPTDNYAKPLKCGYNPYTNIWEDWSSNPLKEKAINFYQL